MELFSNLAMGFGVASSLANLAFCLIGVLLGTLIGVLPGMQGRGIGAALMHGVLAAADAIAEPAVFLLGEPAFYGRFGFVAASSIGVAAPDPEWGDYFQARRLTAWTPDLAGPFRYAQAFDAL